MSWEKIRAVFDCNIFIQVLLNPKSVAAKCFDLVLKREIVLFVSKATLDEVRNVIFRPNIISRLPDATKERIEMFIEQIVDNAVYLKTVPSKFEFERDPKDEMIIDLAVECETDFIVTRDKDLLDLMIGSNDDSKMFRQRFRPLKIVEPIEFLRIVREKDLSLKP